MNVQATPPAASIGEWIRVFAVRFAQRRPEVSAEEAVKTAINEFKHSHAISPEEAVARRCN